MKEGESVIVEQTDKYEIRLDREYGVRFRAVVYPVPGGSNQARENSYEKFEEAEKYAKTTAARLRNTKRKKYDFPVSVRTYNSFHGPAMQQATITGLNRTSGKWQINTGTHNTKQEEPGVIFRRFSREDAQEFAKMAEQVHVLDKKIGAMERKYELRLPHVSTFGDELGLDKVIEAEEGMAKQFKEDPTC